MKPHRWSASEGSQSFYICATTHGYGEFYDRFMARMTQQGEALPVLSVACLELRDLEDEQLIDLLRRAVDRCVADDLFAELFRRYEGRVRGWCERFTGDREASIDLSQEIFLRAYRHIGNFRFDSRFSTWLYAITHNQCRNVIKRRSAAPLEIDDAIAEQLPDENALEPHAVMERDQSYKLMWQLISATLDPLEARVMTLHYGHEVPLAAITEQLALTNRSGAKAYIVSARRKLSGAIRRQGERTS